VSSLLYAAVDLDTGVAVAAETLAIEMGVSAGEQFLETVGEIADVDSIFGGMSEYF
jgi:hypothetical protein